MRIGVSALDLRTLIRITVRSHWLGFVVGILQPHAAELLLGGRVRPSKRFVLLSPHLSLRLVEGRSLQDVWSIFSGVPERSTFGRGSTCSGNGYALPFTRSVSVVQVTSRVFCTASGGLRFLQSRPMVGATPCVFHRLPHAGRVERKCR